MPGVETAGAAIANAEAAKETTSGSGFDVLGALGSLEPDLRAALLYGEGPGTGALVEGLFSGHGGGAKKDPKAKGKETAAQKAAADQAALQAQIQAVQNSPWTQMGNALAREYQDTQTQVQPLVSGAGIAQGQQNAADSALASLGLSSSSGAGQWLAAQAGAAQAQTAPVAAAMAQEGKQYAAEAGPISKALMDYGQANALALETAPGSSWLNAALSHITSNLSYYGQVPTAAVPSIPYGVARALQLSGGAGGTAGAGTTPIQDIGAGPGGSSVVKAPTGAGVGLTGTTAYGAVPGSTVGAGG